MSYPSFRRTPLAHLSALVPFVVGFSTVAQASPIIHDYVAQPQAALVENDITIYGNKIHYAEAGAGPTVILLHGLGGNWQN